MFAVTKQPKLKYFGDPKQKKYYLHKK